EQLRVADAHGDDLVRCDVRVHLDLLHELEVGLLAQTAFIALAEKGAKRIEITRTNGMATASEGRFVVLVREQSDKVHDSNHQSFAANDHHHWGPVEEGSEHNSYSAKKHRPAEELAMQLAGVIGRVGSRHVALRQHRKK